MKARGVGQDPLLARFEQIKTAALREEQLRKQQGLPPPEHVDNPTPTEQLLRDCIAISQGCYLPGAHSGE